MGKGTVAVLAVAGLLCGASAGAATVDGREHRQARRIVEGVRSGELTRREAARLGAEQAHVRAEERRYRRDDGRLGPWERMDLRRDMNRASRDIHRQKHDAQARD